VRIGIHNGHYSGYWSYFLGNLVTLAILMKRWILGVLDSSPGRSFLAPKSRVLAGLDRDAQNVRLAALDLRGDLRRWIWVDLGWILGF